MNKLFFVAVMMSFSVMSSAKMHYTVEIDTVGKYLNVSMQYIASTPGMQRAELKMPIWAPGYYDVLNYAKLLTDFKATRTDGTPLDWTKHRGSTWIVDMAGEDTVLVSYRTYAVAMDVASSRVTSESAFIATNGVLMYEDGHLDEPVEVSYVVPSNWKTVSTGLCAVSSQQPFTFVVPDFDVLYDSPLLIGNHFVDKFRHNGHDYEFAFLPADGYEETNFKNDFKAITDACAEIMQDVPYDNYCVIYMKGEGGGLEHCNSQADYWRGGMKFEGRADYVSFLDFIAHEYFHLYNVKRIRPIELGPFDYGREPYTTLLWFSEGFTSYYSAQMLRRGGVISADELLGIYSRYIHDIEVYEGHKHMSLRQSSYDIWLDFLSRYCDYRNVAISYYNKGPYMGLLFDATILTVTDGKRSLDDLMRYLYNHYYKLLQRGFTEEEFWASVSEVMGSDKAARDASARLRHYVDTTAEIDYESILSPVGILLDRNEWKLSADPQASKQARRYRKHLIGE